MFFFNLSNSSKVNNRISYLILLFFVVFLIGGCKKDYESNFERTEIEILNPVDEELVLIANSIAQISTNKNFKDILYSEVAKRFDGESNALIETLLNHPKFKQTVNTNIFNKLNEAI